MDIPVKNIKLDAKKHHTYAPAKTNTLENWPEVRGYTPGKQKGIANLMSSFLTTGFQATNLAQAVEIIQDMREDKAVIFLSCTSNIITSGLRDTIRYLVEHKMIHALITSAGGIEEDIIKTLKPFVIGHFDANGAMLFKEGINRTGNIFVPNDRYVAFEDLIDPILDELHSKKKQLSTSELIKELGARIEKHAGKEAKNSILYWAVKNNIPVFCPCITDGSLGDLIFFQKQRNKDFKIDITDDIYDIVRMTLNAEKTGVICLGGGTPKHYTLNAQLFRDGCDYAVYINTGQEFDGSDSGAKPDEAVSWGKIKHNGRSVKVSADASIAFPLIAIAGFGLEE